MAEPARDIRESHQFDTEVIWSGMGPTAEMEATGIQSLLSSAGIETIVNGSPQIPTVEFEVLVSRDNVLRARQMLAEALASGPAGADQAERESELP